MQKEREMRHMSKHSRVAMPFSTSPDRGRQGRPLHSEGLDERTIARIGSASCKCLLLFLLFRLLVHSIVFLLIFHHSI